MEANGLSEDFMFDMTKAEIPAETFKKIVSWMEERKGELAMNIWAFLYPTKLFSVFQVSRCLNSRR